ncbi:MAG: nucleotidyltransferase family protein [Armatimonadota bacterium]|nr:nucleotidyltransferase family protein [Armatimonadota bacterium]MDR7457572.1 nucleotidyltransferase family protein [Armatimonadota bacterium]
MTPPRAARVCAVVLAAGSSTRMGRPKLALAIDGEAMLRRVARAALASRCREVVVVLGADAPLYAPLLADLPVRVVHNPDHREGIASSLRVGIRAVAPEADGAVILLGDQPFVTAAVIDSLIARAADALVAASRARGVVGPPVYFARAVFPELLALHGDRGARAVVEAHAADAVIISLPEEAAADVDRPSDLHG